MNKDLLRIVINYIEKGYSHEDLRWGDDLYDASDEDIETCMLYYDEVIEEGTKWAYKQLEND